MDNVKMGPGEMEWSSVDWVGLAQDVDLVNGVMNLRVP
jgi:hypothetical protein